MYFSIGWIKRQDQQGSVSQGLSEWRAFDTNGETVMTQLTDSEVCLS